MWAQLIKMRLQPGRDTAELDKQVLAAERPGSGLVRRLAMHDQGDPDQVYVLVVFESEEQARLRERDASRQEALQGVRAMMADILQGPPNFTDLSVTDEWTR